MDNREYEQALLERVTTELLAEGMAEFAKSLILTGSLGRGEGTYTVNNKGDAVLKSDVELALVVKRGAIHAKRARSAISAVSARFSEDLNIMPLGEYRVANANNFNFTIIPSKKKTVFCFDLYNGSKTLWGHDYLSEHNISVADIDVFEAKRIIANRIAELEYYKLKGASEETLFIWQCKHVLALASAWLIVNGLYVSSYHGQERAIREHEREFVEDFGSPFMLQYEDAFSFLREGGDRFEYDDNATYLATRRMEEYFSDNNTVSPHVNCFARSLKYALKYVRLYRKLNIVGLETRILDGVINAYLNDERGLEGQALVWFDVLH